MSLDFGFTPKGYKYDYLGQTKITQGEQGPPGAKGAREIKGIKVIKGTREMLDPLVLRN